MNLLEVLLGLSKRKKETDFDKIQVTSNGAFYMTSEDIFDDKEESLKLIRELRESVAKHKEAFVKPETQSSGNA